MIIVCHQRNSLYRYTFYGCKHSILVSELKCVDVKVSENWSKAKGKRIPFEKNDKSCSTDISTKKDGIEDGDEK